MPNLNNLLTNAIAERNLVPMADYMGYIRAQGRVDSLCSLLTRR